MDSDEERGLCEEAFDAIRKSDIEKLKDLLGQVQAGIIDRNNKNNTLLHYAVEKGDTNIVELLLDPRWTVNIDATNIAGNTPLHIAALKNNAEIVTLLLSRGAHSDIQNAEGKTPYDLATWYEVICQFESQDEPSEEDQTYPKRERTTGIQSQLYEMELAMLYLWHGIAGFREKTVKRFRMGANTKAGVIVGNLIFECRYKHSNGEEKSKITFVHIKHQANVVKKEDTAENVQNSHHAVNKSDFGFLKNHFRGYLKVKDEFSKEEKADAIFKGSFDDCEFVIFTNVPFRDYFKGYGENVTKEVVEKQSIFDMKSQNHYYRLSMDGNNDDGIEAMVNLSLSSGKSQSLMKFVSKDAINEYFGKLKIYCGQLDESALRVILEHRIRSEFRVSPKDVIGVFADVQYKINKWRSHESEYLTEDNKFFQDSARVSFQFGVKDPVSMFTGRNRELDGLHRSLRRSQGVSNPDVESRMTCVAGLGGIGKTQLARQYIKKHSRSYDDNVIWMNAESDENLRAEFTKFFEEYLQIAKNNVHEKEKDINLLIQETYLFFSNRRSLFVFDNADKIANLENFLPRKLPSNAERPRILITSRRSEWDAGVDVVKLGEFTTTEAIEFVRKTLQLSKTNDATNESITRLVEVLQRFPLAMQQAISYIDEERHNGHVNIDEYLQTFERAQRDALGRKPQTKSLESDYEETTYTTWKITIDRIQETEEGELALEILDIIAHLASNDIRRKMFSKLCDDDDDKLEKPIRQLVKFSMINGEQHQSILHVHRLVQEVTRLEQVEHRTEAKILQKTLRLLWANLPCGSILQLNTIAEARWHRHMLPHCEATMRHIEDARKKQHENYEIDDLCELDVLREMERITSYLLDSERSRDLNKRILEIEEKLPGCDNPRLISALEHLDASSYSTDDHQNTINLSKRLLEIKKKHDDTKRFPVIDTLLMIIDVCPSPVDPQKIKESIKRALYILANMNDGDRSQCSSLLLELAIAHCDPSGASGITETHELRDILSDFQMNDDILNRAFGYLRNHCKSHHDRMELRRFLEAMSPIYPPLQQYRLINMVLERILAISQQMCGTDQLSASDPSFEQFDIDEFLAKPRSDLCLSLRNYSTCLRNYGPHHIKTFCSTLNLADAFGELGSRRTQEMLLEKASSIAEKHLGPDHPIVLRILEHLSIVRNHSSDVRTRKELFSSLLYLFSLIFLILAIFLFTHKLL